MNALLTTKTLLTLPPRQSALLESDHGLGKSSLVHQVAAIKSKLLGKPFYVVDFRLAQCEIADLIGTMRFAQDATVTKVVYIDGIKQTITETVHNVTIHDFPEWFPTDGCGFLFLDELFRAPRDLQNAALEVALDYRYHFKDLPPNWWVISASNDRLDKYAGLVPDPALYDRFFKIKFRPTVPEWLTHVTAMGIHHSVTSYIQKVPSDLDVPEEFEPGTIVPSRRAWTKLGEHVNYLESINEKPLEDENYLTYLAKGYIGDIAVSYVDFVKSNFKVYTAEQLLDGLTSEMLNELKSKDTSERAYYERILHQFIDKNSLTAKMNKNLLKYFKMLPKEEATGFWTHLLSINRAKATAWHKTEGVSDYLWSIINKAEALKE